MLYDIKIKTMFKDQVHERKQFTLKVKETSYQGIFHEGNIQWFHPQPQNKHQEKELEARVHELISVNSAR